MKRLFFAPLLVAAISAPSMASSVDSTYLNVSLTNSNYDIEEISDRANGFNITAGAHIKGTNFSVEGGYADLGEVTATSAGLDIDMSSNVKFVNLKSGYKLGEKASAYGKVGFNSMTVEASAQGFTFSDSETNPMYALGAALQVSKEVAVTTDYTIYSDEVSTISAGLSFNF
jgi:hypothetical protein